MRHKLTQRSYGVLLNSVTENSLTIFTLSKQLLKWKNVSALDGTLTYQSHVWLMANGICKFTFASEQFIALVGPQPRLIYR